jgi:GNAT superfamily N-acetyltransferase
LRPAFNLALKRATSSDADAVVKIVQDVALWLQSRGIPQWRLYLGDDGAQDIRDHVAGKHDAQVYLATLNQTPVGTFCLEWTDEEIWGARGIDNRAGYIHTLAVARDFAGQRFGQSILNSAEDLIRQHNKSYARLDCWAGNPVLVNYYLAQGYETSGIKHGPNGCHLFQKTLPPPPRPA